MMQSPGEGRQFARLACKKKAKSPNEHPVMEHALSLSSHLKESMEVSVGMINAHRDAEQPGDIQHSTTPMLTYESNTFTSLHAGAAYTNEGTVQYPSTSAAVFNNFSGMQHATMSVPHASVEGFPNQHLNPVYSQQIPQSTAHMSLHGLQYTMPPQTVPVTSAHWQSSFHPYVAGPAGPFQQHSHYSSIISPPNNDPLQSAIPPAPLTDPSNNLGNQYNDVPTRLKSCESNLPVGLPQICEEVVNLSTPPKDNSQLGPELSSPHAAVHEQPKGPQATQVEITESPLRVHPTKPNVATQSSRGAGNTRRPFRRTRRLASPSIDVDNEENNMCGGVNRQVLNDTIDLSGETSEEPISKLKRFGGQMNVGQPGPATPYKIPRKGESDNHNVNHDATIAGQLCSSNANSTGFLDPLLETHRKLLGPPPRSFPKQQDVIPSPRRSPRFAPKAQLSIANMTPVNTADRVPPINPPEDHQLPLGGIPKEKRGRRADRNNYMNSNRSTAKRQRPSRAKESDDVRNAEERRFPGTRRPRRKTKQLETNQSRMEHSLTSGANKAPTIEEFVDEDSDNGFSNAIQERKTIIPGSQDLRKEDSGHSPLSNTVGDDSHSDDDDLGAGGNELSSDDDNALRAERSGRASQAPFRKASKLTRVDKSPGLSTQRSRASKMMSVASVNDSDDDNFMKSPRKPMKKGREGTKRRSSYRKTKEIPVAPESPVDLVSPVSSRPKREAVRRSPRNAKRAVSSKNETHIASAQVSDEDFDDSGVKPRGRRKTNRGITAAGRVSRTERRRQQSALEQGTTECKTKEEKIEKARVDRVPSDADASSGGDSPGDEDCDAVAEFSSQDQGSQPIDLDVRVVKKRKKANPKLLPEREFKKLSPDELAIIRVAFIKRYPAPPSNMQAQGRYEAAHGTEMTAGMVQRTWETQLKPWSDRWWKLYLDFNQVVRAKKLGKPRNKDPKIKEKEVKTWLEEYYHEHGEARPTQQATAANDKAQ